MQWLYSSAQCYLAGGDCFFSAFGIKLKAKLVTSFGVEFLKNWLMPCSEITTPKTDGFCFIVNSFVLIIKWVRSFDNQYGFWMYWFSLSTFCWNIINKRNLFVCAQLLYLAINKRTVSSGYWDDSHWRHAMLLWKYLV